MADDADAYETVFSLLPTGKLKMQIRMKPHHDVTASCIICERVDSRWLPETAPAPFADPHICHLCLIRGPRMPFSQIASPLFRRDRAAIDRLRVLSRQIRHEASYGR